MTSQMYCLLSVKTSLNNPPARAGSTTNEGNEMSDFSKSKEVMRMNAEAHKQACSELDRRDQRDIPESDPNHAMYANELFGYGEAEFMAKQYK